MSAYGKCPLTGGVRVREVRPRTVIIFLWDSGARDSDFASFFAVYGEMNMKIFFSGGARTARNSE